MNTVDELVDLLAHDRSSVTLAGACRTYRDLIQEPLVQAVFVSGRLLRVEEPPGNVDTIIGQDFVWHRWPDTGRAVRKPAEAYESNPYTQPRILQTSSIDDWRRWVSAAPADVLASTSKTEMHGRAAVRVTLRTQTGGELHLVVDEATGVWLEARLGDSLWLDWEHVRFDIDPEPGWFIPPKE